MIAYPSHSEIELNKNGIHEYRVEPRIEVYDPPPPPASGTNGCTPGYWKQERHVDSSVGTGIAPGTSFNSTFVGGPLADVVWSFALGGGGGSGVEGALKILRRAAAAAYLNAARLTYGASTSCVRRRSPA